MSRALFVLLLLVDCIASSLALNRAYARFLGRATDLVKLFGSTEIFT